MNDRLDCDVLIVGAGPTGLTLACCLARQGVSFRIVDAAAEPPRGSRGKGLQPRTLELFDDLGILETVLRNGVLGMPRRQYDGSGGAPVEQRQDVTGRADAPFRATLLTPQWRVEEALRARLGVRVEQGRELSALAQDADGVTAGFAGDALRARWVVGCDGGKSTVRHLVGIDFLGETLETHRMLVADVHASGLDREFWHMWRSPDGFLALCPLPSTDVYQLQASVGPGQSPDTTLENLQQMVDRRAIGMKVELSAPTWVSLWRANVRMVDRYRAGRIFLAGDAAHVHSPAGGQGMNTGIQDAYNLAWKLAAVLDGADASLLDTYQEERLPVAAGVLGLSNRLMAEAAASGTISFRPTEETMQLGLSYRGSSLTRELRPPGEGLRAGDRAPEAPGLDGGRRMFDLLRGPGVTLIGLGAQWRSLIDRCEPTRGYVVGAEPGPGVDCVDQGGHVRAAYGDGSLYVVRPDNYVGLASADPADEGAVLEFLQRLRA